MIVQLFNFSHDIALARNAKVFTPPTVVRAMERDLQPLRALLPQPFAGYTPDAPVWGWDAPLVYSLRKAGYTNLPTDQQLFTIRLLSSRRTAVDMLQRLRQRLHGLPIIGQSSFITSSAELAGAFPVPDNGVAVPDSSVAAAPAYILKEAYSSSGRGLRPTGNTLSPMTLQWALRCIRQQGGIALEPYYNKVMDLAMEFTCTDTEICYDGLSIFFTRGNNTYTGNLVAPQPVMEQRLHYYIAPHVISAVREALTDELSRTFLHRYLGPIGVDMMVVNTNKDNAETSPAFFLHPCVEINLRRTMGNLALHMLPLLPPHSTATFRILHAPISPKSTSAPDAKATPLFSLTNQIAALESNAAVRVLTPITPASQFAAVLITNPCIQS